ncbi:MAG: glycosyltransferase [Planctomycetota bacterium]|nr:MAG: glycosyltransferase [Planctomycetota bacterium]
MGSMQAAEPRSAKIPTSLGNREESLENHRRACALAANGQYDGAAQLLADVHASAGDRGLQALAGNDLGVLQAVAGDESAALAQFDAALTIDPDCRPARTNRQYLSERSDSPPGRPGEDNRRTRIAVVSLLFNWPSTGGGTIHTKELCQFLTADGYDVRHFYAACDSFGVGRVSQELPYDSLPIGFDERSWSAAGVRERIREHVAAFDPDWVIVTDSWNTKPLLAEAVGDWPYFLRIAALECVCPLNNVRLLCEDGRLVQCERDQLRHPDVCRQCVSTNGRFSGGLHQAERALAGFEKPDYSERLQRAFANAAGVLAVNPTIAGIIRSHTPAVHVIPSGFDRSRFPEEITPPPRRKGEKVKILFAGLVDELMKGFSVLQSAAAKLWEMRQDFELIATADPPGRVNDSTRLIGWQSQRDLPAVMSDADIVVFPTVAQEALGRSAVEAMGCGRPVVASRIGGLPWVVGDREAGLLFTPGDADGLCRQLNRLLDDAELRRRMGQAGREEFERRFTWDVVLESYRALFGPAVNTGGATDRGTVEGAFN